jgi:HSP20 family protein
VTIHIIRVIRELTDTGPSSSIQKEQVLCSDAHSSHTARWKPNTDIFEEDEKVVIRIELAGVKREDISILLKDGNLTITGQRCEKRRDSKAVYHQLEMNYGDFKRVVSIPESLEHNNIEAIFRDGILYINISKKSDIIEIPIKIEANSDSQDNR